MTERKAACWEAFWLGGTRPSWKRGTISTLMHDCACDICIQTCAEYTYLQFCASGVVRVFRTSVWNGTAMEHVTYASSPVSSSCGVGEPAHKLET